MRLGVDGEGFAGLALRLRGRTGLTQRDVAASLGIHVRSVQLWEAAASHPNAARLQGLIRIFLEAGGFAQGGELEEAEALWLSAMTESPRLNTSFDAPWFARLLRARTDQSAAPPPPSQARTGGRQHWGGTPDVAGFLSRTSELQTLRGWLLQDGCRVVLLRGMGGIGKTLLAARLAHDLAPFFQYVYWRSLHNAPTFSEWLTGAIGFLSPQDPALTTTDDARFNRLLELVDEAPALLVLDNIETVLQPGERTGGYLPGYAAYGDLLRRLAETPHRSCLLLTGREEPPELRPLKGTESPTRSMTLGGLAAPDAQTLLRNKDLTGSESDWENLVTRYTGNGLALKLIGESIHELYGGDIAAFLDDVGTQSALFGGVRQLLEAQVRRLSDLELRAMRRLAVAREPMTFAEIASSLSDAASRGEVREAVEALLRRSLLERLEPGPMFALQAVVLEFVTDQLVEETASDLERGDSTRLRSQPVLNATARDYVRRTQERLIVTPVLERLVGLVGNREEAERRILEFIDDLRRQSRDEQGYAPGNAVNLLRTLRGDLKGVDLSTLLIREAYLSDTEAQDASLAGAHLRDSAVAEAFHQVAVELSPDGAHMLAGTTTGEVCLWRAADRTLLLSMPGHAGMVWRVALSTAQGLAASASEDGTVKLWDASNGQLRATLEGHTDFVQAVCFSDEGGLLASGSQDGSIKLWQVPSGTLLRTLSAPGTSVLSVVLSRDGKLLVSGAQDGAIMFWEPDTGRIDATLPGHNGPVPGLALSADGRRLVSASLDGTVKVWDMPARKLRSTFAAHTGGAWNVAVSRAGEVVASAGRDGTVRLWAAGTGDSLGTLLGHTGEVWDVSLSDDASRVASAGQDGAVHLWDARTGQPLTSLRGYTTAVWDVALSGDGGIAATGNHDGTVSIWDTADGSLHQRLVGHTSNVAGVALSRDAHVLVSASQDGSIKVWDPASGELRSTLFGHAVGTVWDVAVNTDGSLLASASFDGTIKVWDTVRAQLLSTLTGHTRGVRAVAMTDNQLVVSGSQDGSVRVWNARDGSLLGTLVGHVGSLQAVSVDSAGRHAASAGFDGTVRLWDLTRGVCVRTLDAHRGGVLTVALSVDGRRLVSGGFDKTLKIWNVHSGRLQKTLTAHTGAVWGTALSADGTVLASGSFDGTTRLWDVRSGTCLRTFQVDRPYERMDITGLTGITPANRAALATLGAVERPSGQPSS